MRYVGWTIFIVGTGLFVILGDMTVSRIEGKIGVSIMLLGMIVTSGTTVYGAYQKMRERQARIDELAGERKGPPRDPAP